MITKSSPFISPAAGTAALDDHRAMVLVRLCRSRFSLADIAEALNFTQALVRSLVARPFRALVGCTANDSAGGIDIESVVQSGQERVLVLNTPHLIGPITREKETFARHLALEIHHWLKTFEVTDEERLQAVDQASIRLDESTHYMEDKYVFHVERVASEIIWAWKPLVFNVESHQFRNVAGRWLAAWIHFWAADPDVWNRALDIEYASYKQLAEAA